MKADNLVRCGWCSSDPHYLAYHDREWGVPVHDDQRLFEMLILEGAQAGLSWLTILKKRENYRRAYAGFDIATVAAFSATDCEQLLQDSGIVRNRLKVSASINTARAVLQIQHEFGSLDAFLWRFVDGIPRQNSWQTLAELPTRTAVSDRLSKELLTRGCKFVGSTICYSMMQAIGMVNDHMIDCFRYRECRGGG
ncbi:MAG: DNA-3-methyladenine glycosylase I [Deltaproteobacteria bacterium HGW-Deltaproteobacteria-4]|nr:MAG: DNA-3-methyladenine glycosylase I [Deltaproteobacteria bacterium HGW-Deltaproteobacteria-4]